MFRIKQFVKLKEYLTAVNPHRLCVRRVLINVSSAAFETKKALTGTSPHVF